jgi:adenylate cyclase
MVEVAQEIVGNTGGARTAPVPNHRSASAFYRHLVWLYLLGTGSAVVVVFFLAAVGLDFTLVQWVMLISMTIPAVAFYVIPDVYLITRHFRPLRRGLERLDRDEAPTQAEASAAIVGALNLPYYSFVRVTFLHGPMATLSIFVALASGNFFLHAGFVPWQTGLLCAVAFFFASPTHAIFEYFAISRDIGDPIGRLTPFVPDGLLPEDEQRLVSVKLRSKLLYLSIFIAALPLIFFAFSTLFKVGQRFDSFGIAPDVSVMLPLFMWVGGVVVVSMAGALTMSILTASEVSRSAATLAAAMKRVEAGDLGVDLRVTVTDEYADLFRGFNHMIRGMRDEVRMLEVTHSLSGELELPALISRIMVATCDLLQAERSTLFVYDPKTDELWSSFATDIGAGGIRIPANAGIAGLVFTTGKTENIPDAYADPRFDQRVDKRTGYHTRNILCMPIVSKTGARIGVTQVLNKKGTAPFSAKDESRLRAFTAQVAVSLENAQLFDEVVSVKTYNESILKSTSNGMLTTDSEGKVVTANDAAMTILGASGEALIGRKAADVFGGANAWVTAAIDKVAATGERDMAIDASLKIGKNTVSVNMTAQPLFALNGDRIGSMLVFEDITAETRVKSTMARFMSKDIADQVLAGGAEQELGGKAQTCSILFSDVRGFTTLTESLGARETVSLLNEYFALMVDVVFKHEGVLDKYIGDAIMALFGAPFSKPDDADRAVDVANGMMLSLRHLNRMRAGRNEAPIDIGVGIATGEVVVGTIGSPSRMEYTAIGDSVNLASRLEGANKYYRTKILVDEATVRAMKKPTPQREVDLIKVKGKHRPVAVYEVMGYHNAQTCPDLPGLLAAYNHGLESYRARDWKGAIAGFQTALAVQPGDGISQMYIERCQHCLIEPLPDDWDGVWTLTSK